ncbi:MAG TPA: S8 family serine peptidase, partial [Candidatus Limnocylindria bacterium]|nr:S8 family serine peptidase [Candidatus Limnocylindria bacterium]
MPTETLHLLVQFAAGTSDADRTAIARDLGGTIEGEIRPLGVTRLAITVERGTDPEAVLRAIAANRKVTTAEQDARVHLDGTPNDQYWDTDPFVGLGQWGAKKVMLERALDLVTTLQPVIVAVIDTGVDAEHPDLAGVVLPGTTILSSQSTGCAADAVGTDDNSHGTHVAGIIAADANNGIGIAGIAPNARILPIKALDCTGSGSLADVAQAITYAVDHGARVINISLGASTDSVTLESAVQYAVRRNVLIVAAVGNCGLISSRCLDTENLAEYPGASSGVLGVAATSPDDSIASFSTRGAQVALSAPGVRILSTTPHYPTFQSRRGSTMNYAAFSGTSQATPFVAGAAAFLLGVDASLTASGVADRLKTTADDLGASGVDPTFGAGRIDLVRAVIASLPAFSAQYDTSFVPRWVLNGTSFVAKVAITNTSRSTWSSTGGAPVELSYHWLDA